MRETKEIRKRLSGPEAAPYMGLARKLLGELKNAMSFAKLRQLQWAKDLSDGTRIVVSSVFGQDTVTINRPVLRGAKLVEAGKRGGNVSFTLWFFESTTKLVEFDPVSEELTGRNFVVAAAGVSLLFAHGALWFKSGSTLVRVDVASGDKKETTGFGSMGASLVAHAKGIIVLGKTGDPLVSSNEAGDITSTYATEYNEQLKSARLVDDKLYWYGRDIALNKDIAKVFLLNGQTSALSVMEEVTDVYSKKNTNYGGVGGANLCNLAFDRTAGKLHVKPYWADAVRPGDGFDIWQASRGTIVPTAFTQGGFDTVWNYAFSDYLVTDGYYEQINQDLVVPVADKGQYVVLTGGYSGYGFGGVTMARARVYASANNTETASATNIDMVPIQAGGAVWDGEDKIWFMHQSRSSPSVFRLTKVNMKTAAVNYLPGIEALNYESSITVQPHVVRRQSTELDETDWVLKLQEASYR